MEENKFKTKIDQKVKQKHPSNQAELTNTVVFEENTSEINVSSMSSSLFFLNPTFTGESQ